MNPAEAFGKLTKREAEKQARALGLTTAELEAARASLHAQLKTLRADTAKRERVRFQADYKAVRAEMMRNPQEEINFVATWPWSKATRHSREAQG